MPTSKMIAANTASEPERPISTPRPPGLTPLERQLLDQLVRVEQEAQARAARHDAEMTEIKVEMMSLAMQVRTLSGQVSSLTITLGALLGPEERSGS